MKRYNANKRGSSRQFNNQARRTKAINTRPLPARLGYRL